MIQLMPLVVPRNRHESPIKVPWQDTFRNRPGVVGKAGVAGALQQPAEYIARRTTGYLRERYAREFRYKRYHLFRRFKYVAAKDLTKFYSRYYHAKTLPAKKQNAKTNSKVLQKGSKLRRFKSRSQHSCTTYTYRGKRFSSCRSNRSYRSRRTSWLVR